MSAPKYRLTYFNMKSLGEPIRWILAYAGVPYEDDRIPTDFVAWFTQRKAEFASTVCQVPVLYEEGKRELSQSQVISRYLAAQYGLVGDTPWDNAKIDEVISLLFDLSIGVWRANIFFETDAEKRSTNKTTVVEPKFRLYYEKLSKILKEVEGDFILGKKLTHADFWLAHLVSFFDEPLTGEPILVLPPNFLPLTDNDVLVGLTDEFPLLKKHKETVKAIPQIKEWLAKRRNTIL